MTSEDAAWHKTNDWRKEMREKTRAAARNAEMVKSGCLDTPIADLILEKMSELSSEASPLELHHAVKRTAIAASEFHDEAIREARSLAANQERMKWWRIVQDAENARTAARNEAVRDAWKPSDGTANKTYLRAPDGTAFPAPPEPLPKRELLTALFTAARIANPNYEGSTRLMIAGAKEDANVFIKEVEGLGE